MSGLSKPREAALKALVSVDREGAYLNMALRSVLAKPDMEPRDKALATELAFGTMKNRLYVDNIIEKISSVKLKKLSVWIKNILRMGIYSIKFLDRVPVSATVNECVKLSRRYGHSASAGLVNAVLRKCAQSGDFLPNDENSDEYISIKYSYPLWLVKMWRSQGYDSNLFKALNEAPPVIVRINTLKGETPGEGFEKCNDAPHAYFFLRGGTAEESTEFKKGLIAVQDIASQKAVCALNVEKNMSVLDLCAAPGGKSAYIAQLMNNTGKLIACDLHEHKLELIENNFKRLGVKNAVVMQNDASKENTEFINAFDRVIADVPCSGLGILRRKPDIKWTKTPEECSSLIELQRQILDNASKCVKRGGRLLYSTCTINREENEENVKYFLERNQGFKIADGFGEYGRQLLPYSDNSDGFFIAVLERR